MALESRYVIEVSGEPAPQGSKRYVGRGILLETSKKLKPWREAVRSETQRIIPSPLTGGVAVRITFRYARPKSHFGTGRNAGVLKDWARNALHTKAPDIDKTARSVLDGLTEGGAFLDDSQVYRLALYKRFIKDGEKPGALIVVSLEDYEPQ